MAEGILGNSRFKEQKTASRLELLLRNYKGAKSLCEPV